MRGRKKDPTYWVADTESTVPPQELAYGDDTTLKNIEVPEDTRVWATSLTCIDKPGVYVDDNLDEFFKRLWSVDGDMIIYFHNLTWDVYFILAWLVNHGYHFRDPRNVDDKAKWHVGRGEIVVLCNGTGTFYKCAFRLSNKTVELRDSLKLLPFSVDVIGKNFDTEHKKLKGTVDYGKARPEGYRMTDQERAYVQNDVLVVAEALKKLDDITPEWRECLTIGSMCMREYLSTFAGKSRKSRNKAYRYRFPELDAETDQELRKGYYGGWCYVNPKVEDRIVGAGHVYDVNSLYPTAMAHHNYPCGEPHVSSRSIPELLNSDTPFFVRFSASFHIKPGKFPFIQSGKHIWTAETHITDSDNEMDLTLCRPDFELFRECYEIDHLQVDKVWTFDAVVAPFDAYVSKWYEAKQEAGRKGNKVLRQFAKLMLNNLYGKFAQSPVGHSKLFSVDDGYIRSLDYLDERPGGYIPVGAYITAYARGITIRAANANYDSFMYSDTDSIHLSKPAVGIKVDPYELGAWDNESDFTMARFVRQKTYVELDAKTHDWTIKAAGCPADCKERMRYECTWTDKYGKHHFDPLQYDKDGNVKTRKRSDAAFVRRFTYGLKETGKLRKVRLRSGPTLVPIPFEIRRVGGRR